MDRPDPGALFPYFLVVAFLAIGGGSAILPDVDRYVAEVHQWMTSRHIVTAYALAQVAPGPNVIIFVSLIGWQLAGWWGAAVATLPMLVPAITLTLLVGRLHSRYHDAPFSRIISRGLAPIIIGLSLAGSWVQMHSANRDWRGYLLTLLVAVLVLRSQLNPLWLIAIGALAGMVGLV